MTFRKAAVLAFLIVAALRAIPARAQGSRVVHLPFLGKQEAPIGQRGPIRWVGEVGGTVTAIAVDGPVAYLGESRHLVTVDLQEPGHPRRVNEAPVFAGFVEDLVLTGGRLYAAAGEGGLRILDLTDPLAPREVGGLDTPGDARDLAVDGSVAYVADGSGGLRLIDVGDPVSPRLLGHLNTIQDANAVAVRGGMAYVTFADDHLAGMLVADVADPARPKELGSLGLVGEALDIEVAGDFAYIADGRAGLMVVDVGDPRRPRPNADLGSLPAAGVMIDGGLGFVLSPAGSPYQLWVLDLSDPGQPTDPIAVSLFGAVTDLAVADGRVLIANVNSDLEVHDLAGGTMGPVVGRLDRPAIWPISATVSGGHLSVNSWGDGRRREGRGLRVMSLARPEAPREAGRLDLGGPGGRMASSGRFHYVTVGQEGMVTVDASDPGAPHVTGRLLGWTSIGALAASGGHLFVSDFRLERLRVFSLERPGQPEEVGGMDAQGAYDHMALEGDRLYLVGERIGTLRVVDMSDPLNPRALGELTDLGAPSGLAVAGAMVYLVDLQGQLSIVDATDPARMSVTGRLRFPAILEAVAVADGLAWVATEGDGLQVVDVSDPRAPHVLARFATRGQGLDIAVGGGWAYLADGSGGLQIFQLADRLVAP